jgi:phosphoserine aminotransferase
MERKINFNAGPAELPGEVLYDLGKAIQKYKKTGLSILELPHRSPEFIEIVEESKQLVRELCGLNDDYEVAWMHGGGRMQFCMVPQNFIGNGKSAAYIDSGLWAHEASEYAKFYGETAIVASSAEQGYNCLPKWPAKISQQYSYLHITTNNTIHGTQWNDIPATTIPLIADMSSDILSRKHDYTRYAMFYATAQKNLGVSGVGLAVIQKDFLEKSAISLPPILSYREQVKQNSVVNTANVFGIYAALLMLRWTKQKGIDNIEHDNLLKATMLYDALDHSKVFIPKVTDSKHRSLMNICFTADTAGNEKKFLEMCDRNGIVGIRGHRHTGGMRVSLYNAITLDAVSSLVSMMNEFENSAI